MSEREMFEAALELPLADRESFLDSACGNDTTLRQRLKGLLTKHDKAGDFLEDPVVSAPARDPEADAVGHVLAGRYRLLEQIGEGGMGTVWMAQQTNPSSGPSPSSSSSAGWTRKPVLARFEAERQALALMDHPNIARVLDAGTTSDGRPFFVMELVKGVPITKYCDEHQLTPRQRLELFVPVCQAIQHAHQKGIIHRDIKPSNVLVALYDDRAGAEGDRLRRGQGDRPAPHRADAEHRSRCPDRHGRVHEPGAGQLQSLDIDTRSDIYSLGVLLYELLTGSPAVHAKASGESGPARDAARDPRGRAGETERQGGRRRRVARPRRQARHGAQAAGGPDARRARLDRDEGPGEGPQAPLRDGQRLRPGCAASPGG